MNLGSGPTSSILHFLMCQVGTKKPAHITGVSGAGTLMCVQCPEGVRVTLRSRQSAGSASNLGRARAWVSEGVPPPGPQ